MRVFRPLVGGVTYRRWVYLILGGAISVPYLLFAAVAIPAVMPFTASEGAAFAIASAITVAVMVATSFLPAVRVLEVTAVRELLGDPAPGARPRPRDWPGRLRFSGMFLLHVCTGFGVSFASLAIPTLVGLTIAAPFTGRLPAAEGGADVPKGWASAWVPVLCVLALVTLVYAVWAIGAVLTKVAARLLGLSAADRIAELERRAERLAERNRLARELHDSVGHALSVVTVQAGAARRTLHTDPEFTERALSAIEESARTALDDLDHVLGLLREEAAGKTPQPGLADLDSLLSATRLAGTEVDAELGGDVSAVPPVVSREVYRILQECLTNAVRHAGKVPVTVRVGIGPGRLDATVSNPLGAAPPSGRTGGGRGLRGMTERAAVLGGELSAGPVGGRWEVVLRVPWGKA
ncbi:sensor histidine kinase [Amycolatopsis sp. NPDC059027]|uniref:sensor histidine kinase n=1 Tax=Amycolatopsis sp. NPDC059027 TaxID=3346709 RepID=UPI00366E4958